MKVSAPVFSQAQHLQRLLHHLSGFLQDLLGGSWEVVSKVRRTFILIGARSSYKYSYPNRNPSY